MGVRDSAAGLVVVPDAAIDPVVTEQPRHPTVERHRLLRRLSAQPQAPVVLVSGPAGSGKSTTVRQWLHQDPRPTVQLSVTVALDDPGALARELVEVLERIGPEAPDTRASVAGTEPTWSSVVLPALRRLIATRDGDFVLVVDDVHLLQAPACHDAVAAVAAAVPEGSRLVLVSREESPVYLALTRAAGRLLELEPNDLAFDRVEARALFDGLSLEPTDEEVFAALTRSEGWAVGLYLHALSLQAHGGDMGSVDAGPTRRGSDGFVFDYLRSEILEQVAPQTRRFLTRTSILEQLDPEVCDALLDRTDSAAMLHWLSERIQLVIPLDGSGRRFRYHHLFRDALLDELEKESPEDLLGTHRRAALWFLGAGDHDSAVLHAQAAQDPALLADVIWQQVPALLATGGIDRLALWLRDVPDTEALREPRLTLTLAWLALMTGDTVGMDRWLLHAETLLGADWRGRVQSEELAAVLGAVTALVGLDGVRVSAELCASLDHGLPPDSGFRTPAAFIRGVCLTLLRDVDAGMASLRQAERLARALGQPLLVADALSWQGLLSFAAGDTRNGSRLITAATAEIREHRLERLSTSAHCITAQAFVLALNHDPAAVATLGTARRLTATVEGIAPWFAVCGRLVQAQTAIALGDGSLARLLIVEAKAHMTEDLCGTLASDFLDEAEAALAGISVDGVSAATLTAAEIRVLQFLPSHLTMPQIGEHLFLSPNTVKSHTLAIYRKFGVSSRDDAVERAQSLGLVEKPPRD